MKMKGGELVLNGIIMSHTQAQLDTATHCCRFNANAIVSK